jgi:predicted PolB exonuclease-like 3'-5' exonuclease
MSYLIFDIEGIVDPKRLLRVENPKRGRVTRDDGTSREETDDELVAREVTRICDASKDPAVRAGEVACFVPVRFHAPTTICLLLVSDAMQYITHSTIALQAANPLFPKVISPDFKTNTASFWNSYAWAKQNHPDCRLVTFGGHGYDLPVLEITALEYGIQLPDWYQFDVPTYADPRSAFAQKHHLDLSTYLSKGKGGSLSYYSRLIGLPGKLDTNGSMVADLLKEDGGNDKVIDYCWLDTANLYGVLFNVLYAAGRIAAPYQSNPVFETTVQRVLDGRGPEAKRFMELYHRSVSGIPF